jgi:hypothetical protein
VIVKPEGKRPGKVEDNIKRDLREIRQDCIYWIYVTSGRLL